MKLPDFFSFAPLNELRREMSIPDGYYRDFEVTVRPGVTREELDALTSGDGIEIAIDQLTFLPDGTLGYKDRRIFLYIRDVHSHGRFSDPRYHFANCDKLQEMASRGRFEQRYVIAAEATGEFKVNYISNGAVRPERKRLSVCQYCLGKISFEGFDPQWPRPKRHAVVSAFTPETFFALYPRTFHTALPRYESEDAPIDTYPSDFDELSRNLRASRHWKCENCPSTFAAPHLRKYLDVHHVNGDRRDSDLGNLRVLCVVCHSTQPNHGHMRSTPRYRECLALRNRAA